MSKKQYYADIAERKSLARASKHVKRGSKSQKCALPSDNLTPKQLRERSGEVLTYQLSHPLSWKKFIAMPLDIQKEYIQSIYSRFAATQLLLGEMFGISPSHLSKYFTKHEFPAPASCRPTADQKEAFYAWVLGDEPATNAEEEPLVLSDRASAPLSPIPISSNSLSGFSLTFVGVPNVSDIANSLRLLIGDNKKEAIIKIEYEA